jgi:hypothetical protein
MASVSYRYSIIVVFLVESLPGNGRKRPNIGEGLPNDCILLYLLIV